MAALAPLLRRDRIHFCLAERTALTNDNAAEGRVLIIRAVCFLTGVKVWLINLTLTGQNS